MESSPSLATTPTALIACDSPDMRQVWSKAAVLGSLWASFEIVVGSFLHSLHVPFTGTMLSTIGVVILVAGGRMWADPRLLWRAALICALMKSISPNAIIFGPMIGIFMEGLLLFLAVRLLGSNLLGYSVGGALAVSWSLAQKVISLLLVYGSNVGALYVAAYDYAAKSLGIKRLGAYDLLFVLCALQCVVGIVAATAASRIGRGTSEVAARSDHESYRNTPPKTFESNPAQRYSLTVLCLAVSLLLLGVWITNRVPLAFVALYVISVVLLASLRFPTSLRRMRKPRLWIEIAVIMLLSGLILGSVQRGNTLLGGLAIGARMGLRAALVIVGFAAISVELRNPRIITFLGRNRLANLSSALQSAFGFLPSFISALSQHKQGWRHPLRTLAELVALAESLHTANAAQLKSTTVLITGDKGEGKTSLAEATVRNLQTRGYSVAGILAQGLWNDGTRAGFDIVDIATGQRAPLARAGETSDVMFGHFAFLPEGLRVGREALSPEKLARADVIVIDEVGRWELENGGWATQLDALMSVPPKPTILVTRDQFADEVANRWGRGTAIRTFVSQSSTEQVLAALGVKNDAQ